MRIFIAYAKEDQKWVNGIKEYAKRVFPGTHLYTSPCDVKPGERTWPTTLQAIDRADAVIALISRHYIQSNAREEVGYAVRAAQERKKKILPVIIDSTVANWADLPAMIRDLRPINFIRDPKQAQDELWKTIDRLEFQEDVGRIVLLIILILIVLWFLYKGPKS